MSRSGVFRVRAAGVALVFALVFALAAGLASPALAGYELVWEDEFEGSSLDLSKWEPQIGTGCPNLCGWGNNELQYYRAENATVSGGFLTITAKEETFGGRLYTSARLRTKNRGDWTYGRFEMRAKLPEGQGMWPAFWMLPTNSPYGIWPASGEMDIMEAVGHVPERVFGAVHYGGPDQSYISTNYTLPSGTFSEDFHTFALEWEPHRLRWFVDDVEYACTSHWWSSGGPYPAPFDVDFHLLVNLAVGGNLPGSPDSTTVFPQEYVVDWVRVWQRPPAPGSTVLFDGMDHANPFGNGWFVFNGVGGGGIGGNTTDLPPEEGCRASLESGWGGASGFIGGFGRNAPRDLTDMTHFTMWINPDAGQTYTLEINLQDDDNGDNIIPGSPNGADDEFQYNFQVSPTGPDAIAGGGWQFVSIPLSSFYDDNSYHWGGNGIFDPYPVSAGGNGQLINVVVTVISPSGGSQIFRTDLWQFRNEGLVAAPAIGGPESGGLRLEPNVPNPFAGGTRIRFELPQAGPFRLDVYDLHGRVVRELARGMRGAGEHTVVWNGQAASGRRVASGIYFVRLAAGEETRTRKVIVLPE